MSRFPQPPSPEPGAFSAAKEREQRYRERIGDLLATHGGMLDE